MGEISKPSNERAHGGAKLESYWNEKGKVDKKTYYSRGGGPDGEIQKKKVHMRRRSRVFRVDYIQEDKKILNRED